MADQHRQRARQVFDKFDADHSGTVEKKELENMLKELHVFENSSMVDTYADMMFKQNDKDKSGKLDFEEFFTLYTKTLQVKVEGK